MTNNSLNTSKLELKLKMLKQDGQKFMLQLELILLTRSLPNQHQRLIRNMVDKENPWLKEKILSDKRSLPNKDNNFV